MNTSTSAVLKVLKQMRNSYQDPLSKVNIPTIVVPPLVPSCGPSGYSTLEYTCFRQTQPLFHNINDNEQQLAQVFLSILHGPFAFFVFFALKHFQLLTCRCIRWAAPYVPIPFYRVSVHNMTFLDRLRWLSLRSCNVTQWRMELLLWLQNDESYVPLVHIDKVCASTGWNSNPCIIESTNSKIHENCVIDRTSMISYVQKELKM